MRNVSWKRPAAVLAAVTAVALPGAFTAQAAPAAAVQRAHAGGDFAADGGASGVRTALRVVPDRGRGAVLTPAERHRLGGVLGSGQARPAPSAAKGKGPATLRCDRNPTWSDARGTLSARFNCRHATVNWGYKISGKVKSVITGPVHESGVSWWRNGKRMPGNAGHVVGKGYHFHGTLKPVHHGDHLQFQDHMKFRVRIGGKPGTGTLTWAADVRAEK